MSDEGLKDDRAKRAGAFLQYIAICAVLFSLLIAAFMGIATSQKFVGCETAGSGVVPIDQATCSASANHHIQTKENVWSYKSIDFSQVYGIVAAVLVMAGFLFMFSTQIGIWLSSLDPNSFAKPMTGLEFAGYVVLFAFALTITMAVIDSSTGQALNNYCTVSVFCMNQTATAASAPMHCDCVYSFGNVTCGCANGKRANVAGT